MLMLLDIFAALLAVSAAAVWLSARGELLPDGDHPIERAPLTEAENVILFRKPDHDRRKEAIGGV